MWKCEIDNMKVKYSKYMRLFVLWVMLLFKKGDFVWEIKNEMEMCFGQQKWWSFSIMKCGKDG